MKPQKETTDRHAKKAYRSPALIAYGAIAELTKSGTITGMENPGDMQAFKG